MSPRHAYRIALLALGLAYGACSSSGPSTRNGAMAAPVDRSAVRALRAREDAGALALRIEARAQLLEERREAALFGPRLLDVGIVPVALELRLVRDGDPIVIHAEAIRARFTSTSVNALGTERARALARDAATKPPFEAARLARGGAALSGLVFFPSPTMPRATPESIMLELINERTEEVTPLTVPIDIPPAKDLD